jgi:hypothetical protein
MITNTHSPVSVNFERDELVRTWKQLKKKPMPATNRAFIAPVTNDQPIYLSLQKDGMVDFPSELCNDISYTAQNIDTVQAALALYRMEPLLQHIEDWLKVALDFSPVHESHLSPGDVLNAKFSYGHDKNCITKGTISLPLTLLRKVAPPPQELMQHLKFDTVDCVLELDTVQLTREQLEQVHVGDAVILRSSFEPDWPVLLKQKTDSSISTPAYINLHADAILLSTKKNASQPQNRTHGASVNTGASIKHCAVEFTRNLSISAESILGWQPNDYSIPIIEEEGVRAVLRSNSHTWAEGEVIPTGDGYSLWINHLGNTHKSAEIATEIDLNTQVTSKIRVEAS